MHNTSPTPRRRLGRTRLTAALAAVGALVMSSGLVLMATAGTARADHKESHGTHPAVHKVFVCKYVGTPFVDERLQTGNNPISVDTHALEKEGFTAVYPSTAQFPFEFEDAQGRSVAFAWDAEQGDGQQNEPSVADCPRPLAATPTPTPTPTATVTPTPTLTPTPTPTVAPSPTIGGTETASPKPTKKPTKQPPAQPPAQPPTVAGTQAPVPSAVDAGLGSFPGTEPPRTGLLGQLLSAGGLAMMLVAGWLTGARRRRGAHEEG